MELMKINEIDKRLMNWQKIDDIDKIDEIYKIDELV